MTAATVFGSIVSFGGTAILSNHWMEVGCVIRAADERTGCHVLETFRAGNLTVSIETSRRDKLNDRKMARSRPEILTQCEYLATDIAQVVHRLKKFWLRFAQPKHYSAFCDDLRGKLFCFAQNIE